MPARRCFEPSIAPPILGAPRGRRGVPLHETSTRFDVEIGSNILDVDLTLAEVEGTYLNPGVSIALPRQSDSHGDSRAGGHGR